MSSPTNTERGRGNDVVACHREEKVEEARGNGMDMGVVWGGGERGKQSHNNNLRRSLM